MRPEIKRLADALAQARKRLGRRRQPAPVSEMPANYQAYKAGVIQHEQAHIWLRQKEN